MEIKQLQFLQQNIRKVIRDIQEDITTLKGAKRVYDEQGLLELEYAMHNQLVIARKELAKWVALQKSVKKQQRDQHEVNYFMKDVLAQIALQQVAEQEISE